MALPALKQKKLYILDFGTGQKSRVFKKNSDQHHKKYLRSSLAPRGQWLGDYGIKCKHGGWDGAVHGRHILLAGPTRFRPSFCLTFWPPGPHPVETCEQQRNS